MLSRSLFDCQSSTLKVMIQFSQFVSNSQLCHQVNNSLSMSLYVVCTSLSLCLSTIFNVFVFFLSLYVCTSSSLSLSLSSYWSYHASCPSDQLSERSHVSTTALHCSEDNQNVTERLTHSLSDKVTYRAVLDSSKNSLYVIANPRVEKNLGFSIEGLFNR